MPAQMQPIKGADLIQLAPAIGDYDHVRDLAEGRVRAEGLDVTCLHLPPEEIFARYAHEQGLTPRLLTVEDLFPAGSR
jgi:hypothetical protein